jgi:hypothetical protein
VPFIYLQESEQFINLATIGYVNVHPKFVAIYFTSASSEGEMYLEVKGADADHLRKRLAREADNWGDQITPVDELEISF